MQSSSCTRGRPPACSPSCWPPATQRATSGTGCREQLAARDDAREEELRLLRAEVASLRPSHAALSTRLNQLRGELDNARNSLRNLRRGGGTSVWRRRGGGR